MRIAIPTENNRLHGHFGDARHFSFVDVDDATCAVLSTSVVDAPPHTPGAFPRWLHGQGVRTVIAGGIGQRALDIFALHGIAVRAGAPGTPIVTLVADFLAGKLAATPSGCSHHGDHDHHQHDRSAHA